MHEDRHQALEAAYERYDSRRRAGRVERALWLSDQCPEFSGAVLGNLEQMALRTEARSCYVDGRFIATVLTAAAFIEQTIIAELLEAGVTDNTRILFGEAEKLAGGLPHLAPLLDETKVVRERRNDYAHLRTVADEERSFSYRFMRATRHPDLIREDDARDALVLVEKVFKATLRHGELE